jgi:hypothetical protein
MLNFQFADFRQHLELVTLARPTQHLDQLFGGEKSFLVK